MKILGSAGREDVAIVYIAEFEVGELVEFVEAVQPPIAREDKWVLLVSTLYGCPVECAICDAGGFYHGKIPKDKILAQIDFIVRKRYPSRVIPCRQFKIQFARVGEPSFNPQVLDVLETLPERYDAPGLMPSLSTIAPIGRESFFQRLKTIKDRHYAGGQFQFQFSLHTTDEELRRQFIPVKTWGFEAMAAYGEEYYQVGDRKVTLNFALAQDVPVEPGVLATYFSPEKFLIKITPLNPTYKATTSGLSTYIDPHRDGNGYRVVEELKAAGYTVIVSIGEPEENLVGSNCGQFLMKHLNEIHTLEGGYSYEVN